MLVRYEKDLRQKNTFLEIQIKIDNNNNDQIDTRLMILLTQCVICFRVSPTISNTTKKKFRIIIISKLRTEVHTLSFRRLCKYSLKDAIEYLTHLSLLSMECLYHRRQVELLPN